MENEGKTVDYQLNMIAPGFGIKIPAEAEEIANTLLVQSHITDMSGNKVDYAKFRAAPNIADVLMQYNQDGVTLNLAADMVVLGVANEIATQDEQYKGLIEGIKVASRLVGDMYNRRP
ncbi:MAG: hypothetical protein Q8O89_03060 [Nanoarchaeota archaeon]|nr:hypothetical protein [Nanoarchaeota archaeon]